MEKLTCPECGNTVSADATMCENCGFQIAVCPECGAVYKAGQARCTECGRVLSEEALGAKIRDDAKKIEAQIDDDARRLKKIIRIRNVLHTVGTLCVLVGIILIIVWSRKSLAEKLLTAASTFDLYKSLLLVGFILDMVCSGVMDLIRELIGPVKLYRWVKEKKFDYREYVRIHGNKGGEAENEGAYAEKLSEAALFLENPKEKLFFNLVYAFRFAVGIVVIVAGSIWFDDILNQMTLINGSLKSVDWFKATFYVVVISFAIMIIVQLAYYYIHKNHIKNKRQEILNSAQK